MHNRVKQCAGLFLAAALAGAPAAAQEKRPTVEGGDYNFKLPSGHTVQPDCDKLFEGNRSAFMVTLDWHIAAIMSPALKASQMKMLSSKSPQDVQAHLALHGITGGDVQRAEMLCHDNFAP